VMIESNINEGKQTLNNISNLKYGVSITDACINIEETNRIITAAYNQMNN
jgi:3-deoxy-7-phosphoheptulonate synthase